MNQNIRYTSTPKTNYEKVVERRGYFLAFFAFLLALGTTILGIVAAPHIKFVSVTFIKWLLGVFIGVSILLALLNVFLNQRLHKKVNGMQVKDMQQLVYSYRDSAREMAKMKYKQIRMLRFVTDLYAVFIAFVAFVIAFCAGVVYSTDMGTVLTMFSAILFLAVLSRIRMPFPKVLFKDDEHYVKESDYPYLYEIAYKAAKALQCEGEIHIFFPGLPICCTYILIHCMCFISVCTSMRPRCRWKYLQIQLWLSTVM